MGGGRQRIVSADRACATRPRVLHLDSAEAMQLADAQPSPYHELAALLAGTGVELSAALETGPRHHKSFK